MVFAKTPKPEACLLTDRTSPICRAAPPTYYYYIYGDDRGVIQLIAYTTPSKRERYEPAIFDFLKRLEVIR